ncbi:lipocalin family protein [Pontibacter chitinilyticus]|uniref:lipocalin family protein n=1 Tax=Pontibacter chitinilyticus TaxID=2674989 RepID=UPI003219D7CA
MKTLTLRYVLFTFFALTFLSSCDKEEKDAEPSKTDILTAHAWKGDQVMVNKINIAAIPGVGNKAASFNTLYLTFRSDKTYTATFTVQGQEQSQDGTWSFNADESKLNLDLFGEVNVVELTEDDLDLSTTLSQSSVQLISSILGIDPTLIILFTQGKPVEIEMSFVPVG